tara:strand:- start:186 stop:2708 length:2523 start_codon:yes stop_codon:yes gene_type:complete
MSLYLDNNTESLTVNAGFVSTVVIMPQNERYAITEDGAIIDEGNWVESDGEPVVAGDTIVVEGDISIASDITVTSTSFTIRGVRTPIETITVNGQVLDFTTGSIAGAEGETDLTLTLSGFENESEAFTPTGGSMALLAGYETLPSVDSAGLSGGSTHPGRDFLCYSLPVVADGTIEALDIKTILEPASAGALTIKVWRLDSGTLEFIGESSLPALSVGDNIGVPLDTPLAVQSGDILGFHLAANDGRLGRTAAAADSIKWNGGAASDYNEDMPELTVSDGLAYEFSFGANGTLASSALTITSPTSQNRSKQRDNNNQYTYTISGSITDLPANAIVRYSLDGGAYQTLDANPTTDFSGSVTVTSTQDVTIDIYDGSTSYSSQTITLRAVAWILGDGQSNMASRGFNNQSLTLESGAQTPVALKGSTFGIASDPMGIDSQAAGSWQLEFLSLLANANKDVTYGFANVAEGGTSVNRWIKSASDLYPRITNAFNLTGGFEYAITLLGETDASNSMPQAEAESKYGSFIDDKKADFGVDTYLVNFPKLNYPGNDAMRAAFAELVANNDNCFDGGDLRPLDIANTGGDGIHLQTDAQLSGAANIIYAAITEGVNQPPVANAGPDQSVAAGATFTLDGSASIDTDGTIVEYRWTQPAGDTVALDLTDPIRPVGVAPSTANAQTLTFSLITVDDQGAESPADTVDIHVAAEVEDPVENNDLLEAVSKQKFVIQPTAVMPAFTGRSNIEELKFKLGSTNELISLDNQGYYNFDENETDRVIVITDAGEISSENGDIEWEGSSLYVRFGAFSAKDSHLSGRVVVFLAGDERGVVFAGPGLPANLMIRFN